jgi:hypothetical protein
MRFHQSAWLGRADIVGRQIGIAVPRQPQGIRPLLGQKVAGELISALQRRGPILPIRIGLPSASAKDGAETVMEEVQALVDTGASITAVNMSVAERLGLVATGSLELGGVTGSATRPIYGVRLVMPEPGYTFDPIQVVGADLNTPDFEVLIGRNLLCSMLMTYDGTRGQFALTKNA